MSFIIPRTSLYRGSLNRRSTVVGSLVFNESLQDNTCTFQFFYQKSKTPVVTTAEVSRDESTKAESPEQPQAVTMTTQAKASLSTVHVQQSFHGIRTSIPVLTHSVSEVKCFGDYCIINL